MVRQEIFEIRPHGVQEDELRVGSWVDTVALHQFRGESYLLEEERHERDVVLFGNFGNHSRERSRLARAVVGWNLHADE